MKPHNLVQQEYWDSVAADYKIINENNWPFPAIREKKLFFEFAGFKPGDKILEIGCGTGRYTLSLLRMGCKVYATDISGESIKILRKTAEEQNLSENLIAEKNAFEDREECRKFFNQFDYVVFISVIAHLDPYKRKNILMNVVNSLKEAGKIVALEPNPLNPLYYCVYLWRALADIKGRNRWYTEKGFLKNNVFRLKALFRAMGLQKIEVKRYAWFPSRFGNNLPVILEINDVLNKIPFLKEISAFIWIKAKKI